MTAKKKWQSTDSAPRNGTVIILREFGVLEYEGKWFGGRWQRTDGRKAWPTEWLSGVSE